MTIGERIKELRKAKKLTQQQLAELLDIPKDTIVNYENGRTMPSFESIAKLEDFFHVTATYLRGDYAINDYDLIVEVAKANKIDAYKRVMAYYEKIATFPSKEEIQVDTALNNFINLILNNGLPEKYLPDYIDKLANITACLNGYNVQLKKKDPDFTPTMYANAIKCSVLEIAEIFEKAFDKNNENQ